MKSVRSVKERRFIDVIDAGVATMVDFGKNDMMPHFIYCSDSHYNTEEEFKKLKEIILKKMRGYGIPSLILTMLYMERINLITKEKSKQAAEGKLKNEPDWEYYEGSINDDLDSFVNNLHNSEKIDNEYVSSFLLPKLTKEELKLVEQKNTEHMLSYLLDNPDVGVEEMKKSDSKDKYVHSACRRRTEYLSLESEQTSSEEISSQDFADNLSDDSSDVRTTTEWDAGWDAGWAAGWEAGLNAGRMGNGMSRQSDDQPDNSSNYLRSPTRKKIRK